MKRYTLKAVFLLTLMAAIFVAYLFRPTPLQKIQRILTSDITDVQKLDYLTQFLKLGDVESEVMKQLRAGPCGINGGSVQHDYFFVGSDLILSFRWDGTLFRIGYNERTDDSRDPVFHQLASAPLILEEAK